MSKNPPAAALTPEEIIEATKRIDFDAVKRRLKATDDFVKSHRPSQKAMRFEVDV